MENLSQSTSVLVCLCCSIFGFIMLPFTGKIGDLEGLNMYLVYNTDKAGIMQSTVYSDESYSKKDMNIVCVILFFMPDLNNA